MKFPNDPAEIGVADLGTIVGQQAAAQQTTPTEVGTVWVWHLQVRRSVDNGFYGVHTTSAGAWLALKAKAIEQSGGALSLPDDADLGQINRALTDSPFVVRYWIQSLPLVKP
ncbi:hypothetical protein [Mycolicibacterium canariasense]|uniref:hypothetical protein n=1 Tax=Mycolicibacterium canariasense TaxID=228230 RepID=UPI0032D5A9F0